MGRLILVGNRLIFDDFAQIDPMIAPISTVAIPFCRILPLPMLANRIRDLGQPGTVFCHF